MQRGSTYGLVAHERQQHLSRELDTPAFLISNKVHITMQFCNLWLMPSLKIASKIIIILFCSSSLHKNEIQVLIVSFSYLSCTFGKVIKIIQED